MKSALILLVSIFTFSLSANAQSSSQNIKDAGRATNWNDARSQCKALGEGFDLPTDKDMLAIIMSGGGITVDYFNLRHSGFDSGAQNKHPMWIRAEDERANDQLLKDKSDIYYMEDGSGYDVKSWTWSQKWIDEMKKALVGLKAIPAASLKSEAQQLEINAAYKKYAEANKSGYALIVTTLPVDKATVDSLPSEYFSPAVKAGMILPSQENIDRSAKNLENLLAVLDGGFPVKCVKTTK